MPTTGREGHGGLADGRQQRSRRGGQQAQAARSSLPTARRSASRRAVPAVAASARERAPVGWTLFLLSSRVPERPPSGSCLPSSTARTAPGGGPARQSTYLVQKAVCNSRKDASGYRRLRRPLFPGFLLMFATAHDAFPWRRRRGAKSDPVQPTAQRLPFVNRGSFAREDQESGLQGVFRILVLLQHALAHRIDQGQHGGGDTSVAKAASSPCVTNRCSN